jgi:hypothetical protein
MKVQATRQWSSSMGYISDWLCQECNCSCWTLAWQGWWGLLTGEQSKESFSLQL